MSSFVDLQPTLMKSLAVSRPFGKGLALVRMKYHGREGPRPGQTLDEVAIEQQHCGGNSVLVFNDSVMAGGTFSFTSQRHSDHPFGLTLYVNGQHAHRINTCCEYRHRWSVRLGGVHGAFSIEEVTGGRPCSRCQSKRKEMGRKKKSSRPRQPRPSEVLGELLIPMDGEGSASSAINVNHESDSSNGGESSDGDDLLPEFPGIGDDLEIPLDAITSSSEDTDAESQRTFQNENTQTAIVNDRAESDYGYLKTSPTLSSASI